MEIIRIKDFYNPNKVWVIKKTRCRHYFLNQEICGRMHNKRYVRVSKKHLLDVFTVGC